MRYFEVTYPYYSLVKAENPRVAVSTYDESVADAYEEEMKMKEVSKVYAVAKFSRALGENGKAAPLSEVLETFNRDEREILLIDKNLV